MTIRSLLPTDRRLLPGLLLGLAVLVTAGCGGCCDEDVIVTSGNVYVDNLTDTGVDPEYCLGFYLAPVDGTWTGNLLLQELPPATTQFVGSFTEDYYDAEADMEFGELVTWPAVPVPAADDTFFEIY